MCDFQALVKIYIQRQCNDFQSLLYKIIFKVLEYIHRKSKDISNGTTIFKVFYYEDFAAQLLCPFSSPIVDVP